MANFFSAAVQCGWQRGGAFRQWDALCGGMAGAAVKGWMEVALGTHGGVRTCRVVEVSGSVQYLIESEMGVPRVMPRTIELPGVGNGRERW